MAEKRPPFTSPAPALLGLTDDNMKRFCKALLRDGDQLPYHVARVCLAANRNILNVIGGRVPYNLCRNLEWQVCAALGRLPGQEGTARRMYFADAPGQLDVRSWNGERACDASGAGYVVAEIFYLEGERSEAPSPQLRRLALRGVVCNARLIHSTTLPVYCSRRRSMYVQSGLREWG